MKAMWLMLQQDEPDDYVIATGEQHSVREFVEKSADYFGMKIEWMGEGLDEIGFDWHTKRPVVKVSEKYFRPAEVETLLGDPTKAKENLDGNQRLHSINSLRIWCFMDSNSKVYVAGNTGLVGSTIVRMLHRKGYTNILSTPSSHFDLRRQDDVGRFFQINEPEYVYLAAAKVGGIGANRDYPAHFIYDNLMIQSNIINASRKFGVKKLLFLGSSCIYPKMCEQPIKEEYLMTGPLEPTNDAYAIAKIAGIKMCQAYRQQYGFNAISLMPTNLYGPNDNFDRETSHVLPALISKFSDAKESGDFVTCWGDGSAMREFLHVDDLTEKLFYLYEGL